MGNRVALVFAVAIGVCAGEVARAQEAVQPLAPARAGAVPESAELRSLPAPQRRDDEPPRPRLHPWPVSSADHPATHAEPDTAQVVLGMLAGTATVIAAAETYAGTHGSVWYTGAVAVGGALGTGAIVCAVGQLSPTRNGGCRASLMGALVGVLGAVPGLLLLHVAAAPCSNSGEARDGCLGGRAVGEFAGVSVAAVGYALGTTFGARTGWRLGATSRDPSPIAVSASVLAMQF